MLARLSLVCGIVGMLAGGCVHRLHDGPPGADRLAARQVVQVDDYHGVKVADPYRYFENLSDPEVQKWIKGQADLASRTLHSIEGRNALLARIRELDAGEPYRLSVVRRWPNGDLHYLKRGADENLDKLYFRDAKSGVERLLIDPEKLPPPADGGHWSLSFCRPSPNGRYIAYGIAASGSEQTVMRLLDVESGSDLPDTIDRMEDAYNEPSWLADSSGLSYSRRRKLLPGQPATEGYKLTRAYLHRLGDDPQKDRLVLSKDAPSAPPMAEEDFPSISFPIGSSWAIGQVKHGDTDELTLYSAPAVAIANGSETVPWKKICDVAEDVKGYAVSGNQIYLVTASGNTPRYKIVKTSLPAPDFAHAKTVVASSDDVLQHLSTARDGLYISVLRDGRNQILRLSPDGKGTPTLVPLPEGASSAYVGAVSPDVDGAFVTTSSWTRGGRLYLHDGAANTLTDTDLRPEGKFDNVPGFESTEVVVASHDGVKVPLSILHKIGLKLDGSHPTLVSGYGAYGMTQPPHFRPTSLAWLERGGVIAIAHVRGGGEFGKGWHQAGRMATKPNTWKDFIACCQYLVDQKYTSPGKLAGQGGSAGGILIGRAITERPDLFEAALIQVGCLDALRMETTTNGIPNIAEFGSVRTKEGFESLLAMSAYHHVKDGVRYPAVLLTHGIHDPRVEPWMSAKMTARLQAATSSGKPVLFRVDYQAGHGIGSTKSQRQEELADQWAFLLCQMGEPGFMTRQ